MQKCTSFLSNYHFFLMGEIELQPFNLHKENIDMVAPC
jgi:hypothetical protein